MKKSYRKILIRRFERAIEIARGIDRESLDSESIERLDDLVRTLRWTILELREEPPFEA